MPDLFPLSAYADEIDPNLDVQLAALQRLDIDRIDVRGVNSKNVLQLTNAEASQVAEQCVEAGIRIHSVGSPVGKVRLGPNTFEEESLRFRRACELARLLGTRAIRVFTPEVENGQPNAWDEVSRLVTAWIAIAEAEDMVILHENDARYYGAYPENAMRLFETHGGPRFRAIFDFANTVKIGYRPFPDWFPWLLPHLESLHAKDAIEATGEVVPMGEGDGQAERTLNWLHAQGWYGVVSLEPHLKAAGPFDGFSGEALFAQATQSLRNLYDSVGEPL